MAGVLSKKPYLTRGDQAKVQQLKASGALTVFRLSKCSQAECQEDVPPAKSFCSQTCYQAVGGDDDGQGDNAEDDGDVD